MLIPSAVEVENQVTLALFVVVVTNSIGNSSVSYLDSSSSLASCALTKSDSPISNVNVTEPVKLLVPVTTTCAVPCSMLFLYSVVKSTPSTKAISKNLPLTSGSTALPV